MDMGIDDLRAEMNDAMKDLQLSLQAIQMAVDKGPHTFITQDDQEPSEAAVERFCRSCIKDF